MMDDKSPGASRSRLFVIGHLSLIISSSTGVLRLSQMERDMKTWGPFARALIVFSAVLVLPFSANAATLETWKQESEASDSTAPNPQSAIRNPQSEIGNPQSEIRNLLWRESKRDGNYNE
jgi:hypothetical protein